MEIYGNIRLKFDIDENQQYEITEKFIRKILDYPENCFIDDDGNLIESWEDGRGNHFCIEERILRKATAQDKLYIEFINMLNETYHKNKSKR